MSPPPSETLRTEAYERLRRLLFLVPYVSRHQGQRVDEVARALGVSREALLGDLEFLPLVGRPPFQPDDCLDLYVEDDRVFVALDQRLSAPPRLTAGEGVALASAAALLQPPAGGTLASALARLERVLPADALARYREQARHLDLAHAAPDAVAALTRAAVERREVTFTYAGPARAQPEARRVQPLEVVSHRGQWYLSAFCLARGEERLFRVDRLTALEVTGARFAPRESPSSPRRPGEGPAGAPVRVRFSPERAPYLLERFGADAARLPDGSVEVTVTGDSPAWLGRWILSFGGAATVVSPDWAIRVVADAARASLQSR